MRHWRTPKLTSEHALLSASSRERWCKDHCPPSAKEEAKYADRPNKYAIEGTYYHEIAAQCLQNNCDAKDWASLDIAYDVGDKHPEPTNEGLTAVQIYLDTVRKDLKDNPGELGVERRVFITPDHWGTCDAFIWCPDNGVLKVIDYKHGKGVYVGVENNKQLQSYAVGVYNTLNNKDAVKTVELTIVQPRAGGSAVRRFSVDREEFLIWIDEINADVEAALDPYAEFNAGKWCKYCKAAPNCDALKALALKSAQEDFSDIQQVSIHPDELQGEQLADALRQAQISEIWIKAVRSQAYDVAMQGGAVPGFKLVQKRPVRKWKNEKRTVTILKNRGIEEPFVIPKIKSPAAVEKEAGDKEITKGLVISESSGVTLVSDSDGRPAVASSAVADFVD